MLKIDSEPCVCESPTGQDVRSQSSMVAHVYSEDDVKWRKEKLREALAAELERSTIPPSEKEALYSSPSHPTARGPALS